LKPLINAASGSLPLDKGKAMKTIYIELSEGMVDAIYGDKLGEEWVQFIVMDLDNPDDEDAAEMCEGYEPEVHYDF